MHTLPLLASIALLGISPSLSPAQEGQEPRLAPTKPQRLANKKTLAAMQGAWRLTDIQLVDADKFGFGDLRLDHVGYCLVGGNYLSIEFHFQLTKGETEKGRSLVSGLHKFEMENGEQIETSTVIATSMGRDVVPEFEPPGTKRLYRVDVTSDTMILARDDGHTLTFERLVDDEKLFDIFGRPVREKDEETSEGETKDEDGK